MTYIAQLHSHVTHRSINANPDGTVTIMTTERSREFTHATREDAELMAEMFRGRVLDENRNLVYDYSKLPFSMEAAAWELADKMKAL